LEDKVTKMDHISQQTPTLSLTG